MRKRATTETAETLAQIIAGEDLELTGFSVRMRDRLVARLQARDNATRLALLDELAYALRRRQSGEGIRIGPLDALALAVDDILEKNGRKLWGLSKVRRWAIPDKYTQPAEPGQEESK
jgi:hypothetical protein